MRSSLVAAALMWVAVAVLPPLAMAQKMTMEDVLKVQEFGTEATIEGRAFFVFDNFAGVFEDETGLIAVLFDNKAVQDLGIAAGMTVRLTGRVNTNAFPHNVLVASSGTVVSGRTSPRDEPVPLTIEGMFDGARVLEEKPVIALLTFEEEKRQRLWANDHSGRIMVDVGPRYLEANSVEANVPYLVVATLHPEKGSYILKAVAMREVRLLASPDDLLPETPMAELIKSSPIGQRVRTTGRLMMFIGQNNIPLLYDGENVLIIRLSEQFEATPIRSGSRVDVRGTYALETHRGETYGTLLEAQITREGRAEGIQRVLTE